MLSDDREPVDMQTYAKIKVDIILNLEGRLVRADSDLLYFSEGLQHYYPA